MGERNIFRTFESDPEEVFDSNSLNEIYFAQAKKKRIDFVGSGSKPELQASKSKSKPRSKIKEKTTPEIKQSRSTSDMSRDRSYSVDLVAAAGSDIECSFSSDEENDDEDRSRSTSRAGSTVLEDVEVYVLSHGLKILLDFLMFLTFRTIIIVD